MNNLVESSFYFNLKFLRFLGLYPKKSQSKFYPVFAFTFLFFALTPLPVLSLIYYVQDEEINFAEAGVHPIIVLLMTCFVPKLLPFITKSKEIRECIYYLQVFLKFSVNHKHEEITRDRVWICQRNFRCFFVCLFFDYSMWAVRTLLFPNQVFRMDVWLPPNLRTNGVVLCCVHLNAVIGMFYSTVSTIGVDTLISGLLYQAAGQVKILKDKLEFFFEDCTNKETIYQKLRDCTQHHEHIISFVKKIETCFSWVVFSQLFASTVMICFCCLQLSEAKIGSTTFFLMALYVSSALIQIYFYCYYGSTLYEESRNLETAAYLGRWYKYDLKTQKALVLFMERAKIPMTVTAGKMFDLSLNTFTNAIKKSYSLLAVLENY